KDRSWQPRCYYSCGSSIDVVGEGFAVRHTDLSEYFGFDPHPGRKPPAWLKAAVLRIFGRKCAGCRKRLATGKITFDHIIPASKGGLTELGNVQPLCQRCNTTKSNQSVDEEEVVLTFP